MGPPERRPRRSAGPGPGRSGRTDQPVTHGSIGRVTQAELAEADGAGSSPPAFGTLAALAVQGQPHRAQRGRAFDRVRHPRLPGAERAGPAGRRGGRAQPMTYQAFTKAAVNRQRYWARSHLGWRHVTGAAPNAGHAAVAALERAGPGPRDHHAERGRAAPGGGRPRGDRAARVAAPGGVPVLLAALAPGGTGRAAAGGQPALDRGRHGARARRQPGRGRGAGGDRRVHRGRTAARAAGSSSRTSSSSARTCPGPASKRASRWSRRRRRWWCSARR